jgi:curli production assembly/transport component CsgG
VGQGNAAVLVDVLTEVGNDQWFNVVERTEVQSLLSERSLIDQTNAQFRGAQRSLLPPIRFAGILLEGGIINYDSNVETAGIGARILGVGETVEYRRDEVSVALRAVSVATGEVLTSVTTNKIVYSTLVQAGIFKFVSTDRILEFETGYSRNEPVGLAVRQAIELAVFETIKEGNRKNLWVFKNPTAGLEALSRINTEAATLRLAMK